MNYTAQKIASMILANVEAERAGKITWEQFDIINRATWELADRGELCIIGSACAKRVNAVSDILRSAA